MPHQHHHHRIIKVGDIEAVQWRGYISEVLWFCDKALWRHRRNGEPIIILDDKILDLWSYIVKDASGNFSTLSKSEFQKKYGGDAT